MSLKTEDDFRQQAAEIYARYQTQYKKRFRWLRPALFVKELAADLSGDSNRSLLNVLNVSGDWDTAKRRQA